jgi:aminoglycoside phosphotransferase (APT) family kinase protein
LIRTRSLAAAILTEHADSLPRAVVEASELTSTGVAIVRITTLRESPGAVIKIAMTPAAGRGLERETATLAALRGDDRLGRWRQLLPRTLGQGSVEGHPYRVDRALAGRPALERLSGTAARRRLLNMTAGPIDVLHRATATTPGDDVRERWVDEHLRELARHAARRRPPASGLARLRDELREALTGQTFSAGRIHGDYWLGNVLWGNAGSMPAAPVGIVDWDASAPLELAVHDLLHLVLYTRRLLTGRELGHIIRDHLLGVRWPEEERVLLARFGGWERWGSLSERHCLLLYWLRHVAMHARQQSSPGGARYRVWERRNILPVLASL